MRCHTSISECRSWGQGTYVKPSIHSKRVCKRLKTTRFRRYKMVSGAATSPWNSSTEQFKNLTKQLRRVQNRRISARSSLIAHNATSPWESMSNLSKTCNSHQYTSRKTHRFSTSKVWLTSQPRNSRNALRLWKKPWSSIHTWPMSRISTTTWVLPTADWRNSRSQSFPSQNAWKESQATWGTSTSEPKHSRWSSIMIKRLKTLM